MEGFVEPQELDVVAAPLGIPLCLDQAAELVDAPRGGLERALAHHGDLDCLADEANVLHLANRDEHDEGAPLRLHLHQPDLGELDEGLPHRLPGYAELARDIGL